MHPPIMDPLKLASNTLPHSFIFWITLLAPIPLLLLLLLKQSRTILKLPPGPRKLPIIGNLHQLGSMPHHSLHKLSIKYGPLMSLQLGSIPTLIISSSEVAREVFTSHDLAFSSRPALYAAKKISYGFLDMAFAPYGEHWRQVRKLCVLELLSVKRVQSFRAAREEEVALLVASIKRQSSSSSSQPINLSVMMNSVANNIVCRAIFGDKYGGRNYDIEGGDRFRRILGETQRLLGGFCVGDFFPWLEWIHGLTGLKMRLEKNFEELDGFYNQVIEEHLNDVGSRDGLDHDHHVEDLVHVLLRLHKDSTHGITFSSMNHIKGLLTDIFIAGTDTTAATLAWAMAELMKNPRVMNKLLQELQDFIGNKSKVEESDLHQLNYLKLVIKEVLRLHPPAPLPAPRETTEMCRIKGYDIPAKTRVFINVEAIAIDPKRWENPTEFWPERFLSNDVNYGDFDLLPFGVGRRSCPGYNFGKVLLELALANILHCFEWGLPVGMEVEDLDLEGTFGLTVHKKNPLCLVVKS